jgi:hypothetical protein
LALAVALILLFVCSGHAQGQSSQVDLATTPGPGGVFSSLFHQNIGVASGFNNDYLGDGEDRWQTASYARSWLFKTDPGARSFLLWETLELRARGQIITPRRLSGPTRPGERPYAGTLAIAAFMRQQDGAFEREYGVELGLRGPSSGMGAVHELLHEILAENEPQGWDSQLPDQLWLGGYGEVGWTLRDARDKAMFRPFLAGQVTDETLFRFGFDASFGVNVLARRSARDVVTGLRLPVRDGLGARGIRVEFGADLALVEESDLLPGRQAVRAEHERRRARAAVLFPVGPFDALLGLTHLGPEFVGQVSGQTVGTLSLNLRF